VILVDDYLDRVISGCFSFSPWTLGHWKTRAGCCLSFQRTGSGIGGVEMPLSAAGSGMENLRAGVRLRVGATLAV